MRPAWDLADLLPRLLGHPVAVRLRELAVYSPPVTLLKSFLGLPALPPLTGFALLGPDKCDAEDVTALARWLPALEKLGLYIDAPEFAFDVLAGGFPRLRELELVIRRYGPKTLAALAALPQPLESLVLQLTLGKLTLADLAPYLGRQAFPKLTRLGLFGAPNRAALVRKLAASERLPSLQHLGVSLDEESEEIESLLEHGDVFAHVSLFAPNARDAQDLQVFAYTFLVELDRPRDALAAAERGARMAPGEPDLWYLAACCHARLGDLGRALQNLAQAVEIEPEKKDDARDDEDFAALGEDPRFRALVG